MKEFWRRPDVKTSAGGALSTGWYSTRNSCAWYHETLHYSTQVELYEESIRSNAELKSNNQSCMINRRARGPSCSSAPTGGPCWCRTGPHAKHRGGGGSSTGAVTDQGVPILDWQYQRERGLRLCQWLRRQHWHCRFSRRDAPQGAAADTAERGAVRPFRPGRECPHCLVLHRGARPQQDADVDPGGLWDGLALRWASYGRSFCRGTGDRLDQIAAAVDSQHTT